MNHLAIASAYDGKLSPSTDPRELLVSVIKERPSATEAQQRAAFKRLVKQDGFEDYLDAALDRYVSLEFNTARRLACPPTQAELAERLVERQRQVAAVKVAISNRLLDFVMPNGKALRDCTFRACAEAGGWFSRIAAKGKPNQIVGKVLSEADLAKLRQG